MITDYFGFAIESIMHRGTRSFLTVLGIFVGIAAIVALIAIAQGLQSQVIGQFEKLGSNRLIIVPGGTFMGPTGGGLSTGKLTEDDLNVVQGIKEIEIARGILTKGATVKFRDKTRTTMLMGSPDDDATLSFMKKISFFEVREGRQLGGGKYEVVVGDKLGPRLFNETISLGDRMDINGFGFRVVGIQEPSGTGMYDLIVRIPLDTTREIYNSSKEFSTIFASVREGYLVDSVVEKVKEKLRKHRGESEGEETFTIQTTQQVVSGFGTILSAMQIVFIGIASISLIVGGLGIMNTMYTSVLERTRQIGIMKSIGARNSAIMMIFLFEAGTLGLLGGILGVAGGTGLSLLFNVIATNALNITFQSKITLELIGGALAFAFIIGMASGFLPAQRAASMKPSDAMRV